MCCSTREHEPDSLRDPGVRVIRLRCVRRDSRPGVESWLCHQLLTSHIPEPLFPCLEKGVSPYLAYKANVGMYLAHDKYS